jgi:hypothetical protein
MRSTVPVPEGKGSTELRPLGAADTAMAHAFAENSDLPIGQALGNGPCPKREGCHVRASAPSALR